VTEDSSANVLSDFLILGEPPAFEFGKHLLAVHRYFKAASIGRDKNEPFNFAFEFSYELVGQTDRLRFIVSSLAIDDFDFHTLVFNDAMPRQSSFFDKIWP